jgi:hypothetical protein
LPSASSPWRESRSTKLWACSGAAIAPQGTSSRAEPARGNPAAWPGPPVPSPPGPVHRGSPAHEGRARRPGPPSHRPKSAQFGSLRLTLNLNLNFIHVWLGGVEEQSRHLRGTGPGRGCPDGGRPMLKLWAEVVDTTCEQAARPDPTVPRCRAQSPQVAFSPQQVARARARRRTGVCGVPREDLKEHG